MQLPVLPFVRKLRTQFPSPYWIRSLAFKKKGDRTQQHLHTGVASLSLVTYYFEDREANVLLHIQAVIETVPYFVTAGRINYSRYTPVYIAEMKQLEEREPLMYRHMMEGGLLLFVGQRVGFSNVSLQIKPWNKQSIVKPGRCYRFHTAQRRTATLTNDMSHHGRICGGFQRTL